MVDYKDKLNWSKELAERIKKDYDPYAVVVGLTTGSDSNVALKLATMFFDVNAAFTCDTTISAIETLENCERVSKDVYGLKHIVRQPSYGGKSQNKDTYFEIVKQHGFPGKTKTAHNWMYRWLKDHTVNSIMASIRKRKRNRNIVIISGARRHESKRRMGSSKDVTIQNNNKSNIWVNICNEWTDSEVSAFARDFGIDQYRSPISKIMGMSGECFCGCYSSKGELNELKIASPSTYEKIDYIYNWMINNTDMDWDWESGPTDYFMAKKRGQMLFFDKPESQMIMCSTCMNNTNYKDND